jgi:glycosyltransferase 2 family protein
VRDRASTLLKVAVGVGLVAWALSRVPLAEVGSQLASARPGYLLAALGVFWLAILADGIKWHVLLRAQGFTLPPTTVVRFQFIGFFFNNFLPAAGLGGDVMRGYGLARHTERPADAAVSVVVDRGIGFLAYMSSAAIASVIAVNALGREELRAAQWVAALAVLAVLVGFSVLFSRSVRALMGRVFTWGPLRRLAPLWEKISHALDLYRGRALRAAFGIALLGVASTALVNWLVSQAMGGEMTLPMIFLINPLIAVALLLPISIGGLGVSQAVYPFFYGMVGVSAEHALAVSLLVQLIQLVAGLPGGFFWLRNRRPAAVTARPAPEGGAVSDARAD